MKRENIKEELEKEKKKLGELIEETYKKGLPLSQDEAVLVQSRKVDALIIKIHQAEER
ncbi:MAG: hypothetical protein GX883_08440 [Firmicutes bacterium]|nr:hypothetical protein [Bacillota bacterium]